MFQKFVRKFLLPAVGVSLLTAACAQAGPPAAPPELSTGRNLYAIVTERDLPGFAPRAVVVGRFKAVVPEYEAVPGLRTKYFFISDRKTYGGVYLFTDRASADAYLESPLLAAISAKATGQRTLTRFEIPLAIDGPAAGNPDLAKGKAVVRIVRITPPAGAPRETILAGFEQAAPAYSKAPGLVHKWFSIGEDGRFGGIYLFANKAAADAWFSPAWHSRVKETYGVDGEVVALDAPVVIEK